MNIDDLESMGQVPINLSDNAFGLVVRWDAKNRAVGVQVPGESEIRWVKAAMIDMFGGALVEFANRNVIFLDGGTGKVTGKIYATYIVRLTNSSDYVFVGESHVSIDELGFFVEDASKISK